MKNTAIRLDEETLAAIGEYQERVREETGAELNLSDAVRALVHLGLGAFGRKGRKR